MNRSLSIPAVCCLVAFAAVVAALQGATGRESRAKQLSAAPRYGDRAALPAHAAYSAPRPADPSGQPLLTGGQAQEQLTALAGEYLRPWKEWESSPRRYFSRAAPRPVPSISADIEFAQQESSSDSFLLASITVTTGARSQAVPCVVDRRTRQVQLFDGEKWLTADQWLEKSPLP